MKLKKPKGIAQALIGKKFINNSNVVLILADNIFHGNNLHNRIKKALSKNTPTILVYPVKNPSDYGIVQFDKNKKPIRLEEKPKILNLNLQLLASIFMITTPQNMQKNLFLQKEMN